MTPEQFQTLIDAINNNGYMIAGFVSALIFAVTWRG